MSPGCYQQTFVYPERLTRRFHISCRFRRISLSSRREFVLRECEKMEKVEESALSPFDDDWGEEISLEDPPAEPKPTGFLQRCKEIYTSLLPAKPVTVPASPELRNSPLGMYVQLEEIRLRDPELYERLAYVPVPMFEPLSSVDAAEKPKNKKRSRATSTGQKQAKVDFTGELASVETTKRTNNGGSDWSNSELKIFTWS